MLAKVGHPVKKLTRVGMGPLKLTKVAMGEWRELTRDEVSRLKKAAGGSDPLPPSGRGRGGSSSA
jgi:23S rRNA pseudouridine2605 synthase